jgi:hypothetical protein
MAESYITRKGGGGGPSVNFINESIFYAFENPPVTLNIASISANTSRSYNVTTPLYTSIGFPFPVVYAAVTVNNGQCIASFDATTGQKLANGPITQIGAMGIGYNVSLGSVVGAMLNFSNGAAFAQRFNPFTLSLEANSPVFAQQLRNIQILESNVYVSGDNNLVKLSSTLQLLNFKSLSMGGNILAADGNLYALQGNGRVFRYIPSSNLNTPNQNLYSGYPSYIGNVSFSNGNLYIQSPGQSNMFVVNTSNGQATIKQINAPLVSAPLENNNFVYVFTNRSNGQAHIYHSSNLTLAFNYAIKGTQDFVTKNFVNNNLYFSSSTDPIEDAISFGFSNTVRSISFNGAIVSINNQQYYLFKK